ncbi:MAG: TraB/GumN family protein [Chitinophagaceae bacterium]|nr:TraB/GumN family protein [Chitinophagaceae bacterium]
MKQNTSTKKQFTFTGAKKRGIVILFFFFGIITVKEIEAQTQKPGIFYSISGNGLKDTSYLFGTYHLVKDSYLDELPGVKASFAKAKGIVVEIIADSAEAAAVQSMGMMTDKTLTGLIDQPFRDSLDTELKNSIGVGLNQLDQFKPMNITLTLSIVHMMKSNRELLEKYTGLPLDAFFARSGKDMGKTVKPLETIKEQMDLLFNSASIDEQVTALKTFIRKKTEMAQLGDELIKKWFDHDLEGMNDIYEKTLQESGEEDRLIRERNSNWMKILPGLLHSESQFIAVGALHLGGEFGLVEQLKQKGYTVTPVK